MESLGVVDSAAMPRELDTANQGFFVNVLKDTVTARYTGKGNHSNDVGTVRGDKPVPANIELYYFEVTIVNAGEHGSVTVGLVSEDASSNLQPGAEPGSYGYRGSDGRIFHASTTGREYASSFTAGDVIGCGLDLQKQEIFFTKNGTHLGIAFRSVRETLYPAVGLHSFGEVVRVNFGQEPFRYDVQALLAENRARERVELEEIQVDELVVNRLVRDYLLYCGYSKTLSALDAATGIGPATYESTSPWPKTVRAPTTGTSNGGVQRMDLETSPPQGASISFAPSTTYQWQGEQKRDEDEEEFDEEEGDDDDDSAEDHDISLYTGSPRFARSEQQMATPPGPAIPQTIVRDAEYDVVLTDGLCDTRDSPYWDSLEFRSEVRSCILKGDIDEAVRLCRTAGAPSLERNKQVWCQLKCLQFTNFIRAGDIMQAIQHARKELYPVLASTTASTGESARQQQQQQPQQADSPAQATSNGSAQNGRVLGVKRTRPAEVSAASSASPASPRREVAPSRAATAEHPEIEAVRQVLGLLAYHEPQTSPLAHLLSPVHAEFVADSVDDLLLGNDVRSYRTGLHLICSQLLAVKGALREAAGNKGKVFQLDEEDGEESHKHDLQYSAFPIEDAVYEFVRARV